MASFHLVPLQKIYSLYGMLALFNSCMVAGKSLYLLVFLLLLDQMVFLLSSCIECCFSRL